MQLVRVTRSAAKDMLFWKKTHMNSRRARSIFATSSICKQRGTYNISFVGFLMVLSHTLEKLSKIESKELCLKEG